jgi:hypothetical protein
MILAPFKLLEEFYRYYRVWQFIDIDFSYDVGLPSIMPCEKMRSWERDNGLCCVQKADAQIDLKPTDSSIA